MLTGYRVQLELVRLGVVSQFADRVSCRPTGPAPPEAQPLGSVVAALSFIVFIAGPSRRLEAAGLAAVTVARRVTTCASQNAWRILAPPCMVLPNERP